MQEPANETNLPAQIAEAVSGVPKALIPASLKALDRLLGSVVDLPVAWLSQQKAKIDAQTAAYSLVEAAIAKAAASEAGADPETVGRAMSVLVRKSYRKQTNREAVGAAMIEDLRSKTGPETEKPSGTVSTPDDDWLNVFERYAEDASSERMQGLWGRVLAGEVRKPGRFSLRTLRFLSEFSQADALLFSEFCESAFESCAPKSLVHPDDIKDMSHLFALEQSGLIHGADGFGLTRSMTFDQRGSAFMREGSLVLLFKGEPGVKFSLNILALTTMGSELLSLIPNRDARAAARRVAHALRKPEMKSALLATVTNTAGQIAALEILWQEEAESVSA